MSPIVREWNDVDAAQARGDLGDKCLYCRRNFSLERAHVTPRARDGRDQNGRRVSSIVKVDPLDIVLLCGPTVDPLRCHYRFDHGQIDLMPAMVKRCPEKVTRAVERMGMEKARRRLAPSDYAPEIEEARKRALEVAIA